MRLNAFPILIPPLRERMDDMPELVESFIARFAAEEGKRIDSAAPEALELIRRYGWPGNIRQLENAIYRAVVLAEGSVLTISEFPQIAAHVEGYSPTTPPAPAFAAQGVIHRPGHDRKQPSAHADRRSCLLEDASSPTRAPVRKAAACWAFPL